MYVPAMTRQELIAACQEIGLCSAQTAEAMETWRLKELLTAWIAQGDECATAGESV